MNMAEILRNDVEQELRWDPSVCAEKIGVSVNDGVVELDGHVGSLFQKWAAERAALRVAHVTSVASEIIVDLPVGDTRTDADIAYAAMGHLTWNTQVPDTIQVKVSNGGVTLMGTAEWHFQKDEAERVVRSLSGVKAVVNEIELEPKASGSRHPLPNSLILPTKSLDFNNREHRSLRTFGNLDEAALKDYAAIGVETSFARGATLFSEGTRSRGVYVICTGQVKLFCTSKGGKTLILKIAMPGDVLGLGAVLSDSAYETTAETIQTAEIKSIRREEFLSFLAKHGEASLQAAKAVSDDYKAAFFDSRRLALSSSAAGRLAGVLLDLGKTAASCGKLEMRFTMALTHEELANIIGGSRETVTRMLTRFKKEKLIEMRGSSVMILAPELMESLVA